MYGKKPLSKSMLLPGSPASVQDRVLRIHLALAALLSGKGNGHQMAVLIETAYLTWFLCDAGVCHADHADFKDIERMIGNTAHDTALDLYALREDDKALAAWLLDLHERQLRRAPVFTVLKAQERLAHFARSSRAAPWERQPAG
ncbi:hypothetical protein [Paraburkholderia bannensis]|uniref:hypothetical protein n=1 Tax=Paraburkholderia bannensis TaxID=765414 RepID=UPI002AB62F8A|nr:hypothetical protein [Paraburkholderia bannensis]